MSTQMHKEVVVAPSETHSPESELMVACAAGWLHVVRRLIGAGVDANHVNEQGETPLTYAATWGHESVVACLLAKGAKVDHPGTPSWTPLMYAASRGNRRVVLALLINGADIVRTDRLGRTAADLAKNAGHTDCASLIKTWGRPD
jgi:ankyrin repeat protein